MKELPRLVKDMTGLQFNRLKVISFSHINNQKSAVWLCECACGNNKLITGKALRNGHSQSCGCLKQTILKSDKKRDNLVGQVFNRLTVVEFSHIDKWRNVNWKCSCSCGNPKLKIVPDRYLKQSKVKSCGCLRKEMDIKGKVVDIVGKKFNKLTVIRKIGVEIKKNGKRCALWECLCDCGNKIQRHSGTLTSGNTKSCGCLNHRTGKNNPGYNHDLTEKERIDRRQIPEFRWWRTKVYQRDNYICQISGQNGGDICAHHLESWNSNKDLRFDVSNGITISRKIHILFHKIYGRGNNTLEQFNEFKMRYTNKEFVDIIA